MPLCGCPVQIATAAQLEPATRSLAAECLVTLCEARDKVRWHTSLIACTHVRYTLQPAAGTACPAGHSDPSHQVRSTVTCLVAVALGMCLHVCLLIHARCCHCCAQAPGMVRKLPNFVSSLFEALMHFLLDIEDDPDWHRVRQTQHRTCVWMCLSYVAQGGGGWQTSVTKHGTCVWICLSIVQVALRCVAEVRQAWDVCLDVSLLCLKWHRGLVGGRLQRHQRAGLVSGCVFPVSQWHRVVVGATG
jgi:hypothetical protein